MALLRWGCTQADKEGVNTYLEATDGECPPALTRLS